MTLPRPLLVALLLALALAACAPRTDQGAATPPTVPEPVPETEQPSEQPTPSTDPAALEVERAAQQAFHLMGLEYSRTGVYSVNVLASDLELPSGARWQLENIADTTYALRFTSDNVPEIAWLVTPEGVSTERVEANEIL
jgi:hypothetical protein